MTITTITLPNGITVETTDTIDLSMLMATAAPEPKAKQAPTTKAQAPTQPKAQAQTTSKPTAKATAKAKVDGKALMTSIREAQARGDIDGACLLASEAGWAHVVESIKAKAAAAKPSVKAAPQPKAQAPKARTTAKGKRATTTVAAAKATDTETDNRTAPKVVEMSVEAEARRQPKHKGDKGPMGQGIIVKAEGMVAQAMIDGPDALVDAWVALTEQVEFLDIGAEQAQAAGNERRARDLTAQAVLLAEVIATIPQPATV